MEVVYLGFRAAWNVDIVDAHTGALIRARLIGHSLGSILRVSHYYHLSESPFALLTFGQGRYP